MELTNKLAGAVMGSIASLVAGSTMVSSGNAYAACAPSYQAAERELMGLGENVLWQGRNDRLQADIKLFARPTDPRSNDDGFIDYSPFLFTATLEDGRTCEGAEGINWKKYVGQPGQQTNVGNGILGALSQEYLDSLKGCPGTEYSGTNVTNPIIRGTGIRQTDLADDSALVLYEGDNGLWMIIESYNDGMCIASQGSDSKEVYAALPGKDI